MNLALIIKHDDATGDMRSMAEGISTRIRVIGPTYLGYESENCGENCDKFWTNYTLHDDTPNDDVTIKQGPTPTDGIPIDIEFANGLKFADFVYINFTMTVDKHGKRPVGSGSQETAVVFHPICQQNVFASYPADTNTFVSCGTLTSRPFTSLSPGKCCPLVKSIS